MKGGGGETTGHIRLLEHQLKAWGQELIVIVWQLKATQLLKYSLEERWNKNIVDKILLEERLCGRAHPGSIPGTSN